MGAANAPVARRYAKAVFELAREAGQLEAIARELSGFAGLLRQSAELRTVLTTPGLPLDQRQDLLRAILERGKAGRVSTNVLLLLVERNRLLLLDDIVTAYQAEADRADGRVRARVTSARALTPAQVASVKAALEKRTGGKVEVETHTDAELLGGVVAEIGSFVYDGSVKSQLRRLRGQVAHGAAPTAQEP